MIKRLQKQERKEIEAKQNDIGLFIPKQINYKNPKHKSFDNEELELDYILLQVIKLETKKQREYLCKFCFGDKPEGVSQNLEYRPTLFIEEEDTYYKGQWIKNTDTREGKGIAIRREGELYEGWWKDSCPDGKGRHMTTHIYEGEFKDNAYEGVGTITYKDGIVYHGEFHQGEFQGYGKHNMYNGVTYCGEFSYGKKQGKGLLEYPDGESNKCKFVEGKICGMKSLEF